MIKSKEELRRIASGVASQIKNDMIERIVEFMNNMGTSSLELADALDITVEELEDILNGGEISLTTLAKIIVASEHTIEIKPLPMVNAPFNRAKKRTAEPFVTNTRATRGRNGEPIPSYEEFQQMVREGKIPPPPRGMRGGMPMGAEMPNRFGGMPGVGSRVARNNRPIHRAQTTMNPSNLELESMSRRDLVSTITNNGWAEEIDLVNANRSDLINFLLEKDFHTEEAQVAETRQAHSDKVCKMAEALADVIEKNPQLASMLEKYVG